MREVIAKAPAVAGNAAAGLDDAQPRPQADGIVRKHRLAQFTLQSLDHTHGRPISARHDDGVRVRPVCAAREFIRSFRPGPAELDRSHEPYHLAMDDLETAH